MSETKENNNGLYLIVGALIVAVLVMGYFMLQKDSDNGNPIKVIERTVDGDGDGFEINLDENGLSGTIRETE